MESEQPDHDDISRAFSLSLIGGREVNRDTIIEILSDTQKIKYAIDVAVRFDMKISECPNDEFLQYDPIRFFMDVEENLNLIKRNHLEFLNASRLYSDTADRYGNTLIIYDSSSCKEFAVDIFGNHWGKKEADNDASFFIVKKGSK